MLPRKKLGKRSRYYHSQIDMELLLAGMDYAFLPDSYVIFICDFDPFGKKKYCYTFDAVCREDSSVSLEDGSNTLFLSTLGENEDEVPEGLVKFLRYVSASPGSSMEDFEDDFVRRLQEAVRNVKASREMEARYMLFEELIKEEREDAKAEGKAEGKAETILAFLSRLGDVSGELREKILKEKNLDELDSFTEKAVLANTIEEFQKLIEQ